MTPQNKHIKLIGVSNLYSIIDDDHVQGCIIWSIRHFHTKHGVKPDLVLLHPDYLDGCKGPLEFEHESGEVYQVEVRADKTQRKASFMIEARGLDSQG